MFAECLEKTNIAIGIGVIKTPALIVITEVAELNVNIVERSINAKTRRVTQSLHGKQRN